MKSIFETWNSSELEEGNRIMGDNLKCEILLIPKSLCWGLSGVHSVGDYAQNSAQFYKFLRL